MVGKKQYKHKRNSKKTRRYTLLDKEIFNILPLILIGAIVPLIVRLEIIELSAVAAKVWSKSEIWDFFSYFKARWLMVLTGIAFLIFLLRWYRKEIIAHRNPIYIPMSIYALCIMLSSFLADPLYREIAFNGFPNRNEGAIVWLIYLLIVVIAYHSIQNEKQLKLLVYSLFGSAMVISIVGIFQYFGYDLFRSEVGKLLIISDTLDWARESFKGTIGKYSIYGTFNNTNYMGSYMAMIVPMAFVLYIFASKKNNAIVIAIVLCLAYSNLLGSNSRAGMVAVAMVLLLILITLYRPCIQRWKRILVIVGILLVITVSMDYISGGKVFSQTERLIDDVQFVGAEKADEDQENYGFNDLVFDGNKVTLDMTTEMLAIQVIRADNNLEYKLSDYIFSDGSSNMLTPKYDEENYIITFQEEAYRDYIVYAPGNLVRLIIDEFVVDLGVDDIGAFKFIGPYLALEEIEKAPYWGFEGREKIGSSRGYIWSRSIPLLMDTKFVGYGPDTFVMHFPQSDYIAKQKYLNDFYMVVDKPHNLYLQIALGTGVISLVAFMAMFMIYYIAFIKEFIRYIRGGLEHSFYSVMGFACSFALTGYLIAGIFNDSVVSVAPVFWLLMGTGLSCMQLNVTERLHLQKSAK